MFWCKHEWKLLSETVTKSKYEVATDALAGSNQTVTLPWQLCCAERKHIQSFTCAKYGYLKRYVENI